MIEQHNEGAPMTALREAAYNYVKKWVSPFAEDAVKDQAVDEFIAAIFLAIREPTKEMFLAAYNLADRRGDQLDDAAQCWRDMLDVLAAAERGGG